jgi:hypothetical protein
MCWYRRLQQQQCESSTTFSDRMDLTFVGGRVLLRAGGVLGLMSESVWSKHLVLRHWLMDRLRQLYGGGIWIVGRIAETRQALSMDIVLGHPVRSRLLTSKHRIARLVTVEAY